MPAAVCAAVLSLGLLGSAARPVVDGVPPATGALAQAAERAFDEGRFKEAAQQASLALGELAQGPRGVAIGELTRELEMLWGAALASVGQDGQAMSHFRAALEQDPDFVPNAERFAPPIRQRVEKARKEMQHAAAPATLEIDGTVGATIYLDGLARGNVPAAIAGAAGRHGWVWLVRDGARSLAYPATFGTPLAPIEITGSSEAALPVAPHLTAASAAVAPAAATSSPPEASVSEKRSGGTSPVVWIVVAAVGVAAGIAVGAAIASSSSQSGMAVGIQSSAAHP